METRANYTLVGSFVVFSVVVMVAFILWVARVDFSRKGVEYEIYFSRSVTGLKEGGAVLYRGVPVGTVQRVALDAENVENVQVVISIQKSAPIMEDATASLELQGITGIAYIQLNGGTKGARQLQAGPYQKRAVIPTRSSVLEEVTSSLPAVLQQVARTFEEIRPLFNEGNRKNFEESLKNIHAITKTFLPNSGKEGNVHELLLNMNLTLKEFRLLVGEIKTLLTDNRPGIHHFTDTGVPALTQFLTEGKEALSTIRRIGESLERSPSRFIYNDPRQGVKVP